MPKNTKWNILPKKIGAFEIKELPEDVKDYLADSMLNTGAKSLLPIVREMLIKGSRNNILGLNK